MTKKNKTIRQNIPRSQPNAKMAKRAMEMMDGMDQKKMNKAMELMSSDKFSKMMNMENMAGILENDNLPKMMEAITPMADVMPKMMPVFTKIMPKLMNVVKAFVEEEEDGGKPVDEQSPDEVWDFITGSSKAPKKMKGKLDGVWNFIDKYNNSDII